MPLVHVEDWPLQVKSAFATDYSPFGNHQSTALCIFNTNVAAILLYKAEIWRIADMKEEECSERDMGGQPWGATMASARD